MDWFILGIEPTKDKKAITAAYRQKLRQTNPEDKPEAFMMLRTAYEQALAFADEEETPARDQSPVGLWMEAVQKLYDDYPSRIDPEPWRALMAHNVCIGLDTRPAAEEALLKFLMETYFLPKPVWQVLDEAFHFSARAEELYESWPREFIDHAVLSGIRFDPMLDYTSFTPGTNGKDCDAFRRLFAQANQIPVKDIGPCLAQMDALSERHPYGEALRCRFYMATGREEEGKDGLRQLAAQYPDDAVLAIAWAELCLEDGNAREAGQIAEHILKIQPKHIDAKIISAKCLAEEKEYHEAKELLYELVHSCGDNPMAMEQLVQLMKTWNNELIRRREETYAQAPEDTDNLIELAWCYAQNDRMDKAMELALKVDPNYEDAFAYHNLMGKLYHNSGKFSEALPHLEAVVAVLQNMTDDGTKETRKRLARLPEMLQVQGHCLMQVGRTEEAEEKFRQTLQIAPENMEILSIMGKILFNSCRYDEALEIFHRTLQLAPDSWASELLASLCFLRTGRDREAFEAVNRAIAIQGNDLLLYIVKMQILIRNGVFEDVYEILSYLKENGAPDDISTDFIWAELTELEKKDDKTALQKYRALQKRVENGEDLIWTGELYYRLAVLTGNTLDLRQEKNRKIVLELAEKGLAFNKQDADLLSYKAWVLKKGGSLDAAIAMYQALLDKNPKSVIALRGIADIYYGDLERYAAQALTYYEKLLEQQKTAELFFYAATCKRQLGDTEGARKYYLKELEMDGEDIDVFHGLAYLSDSLGNYGESLQLLDQGLAIMEEYDRAFDPMVEHKAQVLRRMGRFREALDFIEDAAQRHHFSDAFQVQFDICCQAGWWDQAKQVLDRWKLAAPNDPARMAAAGRLYLLQGKPFKAALAMGPAKHKVSPRQAQDFRLQLAELEQNYTRQMALLSQRVQADPEDDHSLALLAFACWQAGRKGAARDAAEKALQLLDDILSRALTDEPLYRSRRSLMLAILGREEEARAELARTRALPLCHFCERGSCMDADIYEAQIEEILGNTENAKNLYTEGRKKWPDDLDFVSGQQRLKKKGRK